MIDRARQHIAEATSIVAFSGAGLSAESGVPTFRDAQTGGLWARYDPYTLASPEGFAADPQLVIDWYTWRRQRVAEAQPNAAHRALAAHTEVLNVTQNVDDLLHRAGAAPEQIIQVHGTIAADRCHAECGYTEPIDLANPPPRRDCPDCAAPLRPAVVWFGEQLPPGAWDAAELACASCDVLLVIGTTAAVYPAAGLINLAKNNGATIIVINTQPSEASGLADIELIGPAGEVVPSLLD